MFGTKGSLEWCREAPGILKYTKVNQPTQIMSANRDYMYPESQRISRIPAGHPEGYFEAFGNLYHAFCEHLMARLEEREPETYTYPTVEDGVKGLRFVKSLRRE